MTSTFWMTAEETEQELNRRMIRLPIGTRVRTPAGTTGTVVDGPQWPPNYTVRIDGAGLDVHVDDDVFFCRREYLTVICE